MNLFNSNRHAGSVFLMFVLLASAAAECSAQFQYPPYGAWRGRMVDRDGLFHSQRYRWGGGLTATGGEFLTNAVGVVAPLAINAATGRDADSDSRSDTGTRSTATRSVTRFEAPPDYVREQQRANDLLARTARLLDPSFDGGVPSAVPGTGQQGAQPPAPAGAANFDELRRQYNIGSSPFNLRQNN